MSLCRTDYAVQQTGSVLQLPEVVAIVQIWRMAKKNESAAAAGAATAAGGRVRRLG